MEKSGPRIALSAGEVSGDEHAADLVAAIKHLSPDAVFAGMGGRNLASAGMRMVVDSEREASVMGFKDVLWSFRNIYNALSRMKALLREWKPDVLVLVDFPDFNFRLGKAAAQQGIKVFYYITPKLWAWRRRRVSFFRKYVAKSACIFPFEPSFFSELGYPGAVYVGHPFSTRFRGLCDASPEEKRELRIRMGINPVGPVICFFPGSRKSEIREHGDLVAETWLRFKELHGEAQALLAVAPSMEGEEEFFARLPDFRLIHGDPIAVMRASDAGMIKSGTSNLQAAFCGLPFFMFFRISRLAAFIAGALVDISEFSIVNVIRSGTVKELLQGEANPECAAREMDRLLSDTVYREKVLSGLDEVRKSLSSSGHEQDSGISSRAAGEAAELVCGVIAGVKGDEA